MDNKFKKSKYAAIILASTMALSTVASVTPQAFGENAITAKAAASTGAELKQSIAELDPTDLIAKSSGDTYTGAVTTALSDYEGLTDAEKKKVSNLKLLNAHKAVTENAELVAAIRALTKSTTITEAAGTTYTAVDTETKNSITIPKTKEVKGKKGTTVTAGYNQNVENVYTALTNFKTAYDAAVLANKDVKTALAKVYKEYTATKKAADKADKAVNASFVAKSFLDLYTAMTGGGKYTTTKETVKLAKDNSFKIDSDKYILEVGKTGDEQGKLYVVDPTGEKALISVSENIGTFTITEKDDENDEAATLINHYTVTMSGTSVKKLEKAVEKAVTTETEAEDGNFQSIVKFSVIGLDAKMSTAEYKKLKAGTTKYSDPQLDVINAASKAYKKLSADAKKAVTADQLATLKAYEADAKIQAALEKKLVSEDAKGVTKKIGALKFQNNDVAKYKGDINEASGAYNDLSKKYKKKVKAATVKSLENHKAALEIIEDIAELDTKATALLTANSATGLSELEGAISGINSKTTGSYYKKAGKDVDKKVQKLVKNFKNVANYEKLVAAQKDYFKNSGSVTGDNGFEAKLTALTGTKTLRVVNNMVLLGNAAADVYKITVDKKTKEITLTQVVVAEGATATVYKLASNTEPDTTTVSGYALTNNKGKFSASTALASDATSPVKLLDLKGKTVDDFKALEEGNFYDKDDITAINEAVEKYTKANASKTTKAYINKEDATKVKAYQTALKQQDALVKKVAAEVNAAVKVLKYSTETVTTTVGEGESATTKTISKYESDYNAAKEKYNEFAAKYAYYEDDDKTSLVKASKTALVNHEKAAETATAILAIPAVGSITVTSTKNVAVETARGLYDELTAEQKKLIVAGEATLKAAEERVKAINAMDAAITLLENDETKVTISSEEVSDTSKLLPLIKALDTATPKNTAIEKLTASGLTVAADKSKVTVTFEKATATSGLDKTVDVAIEQDYADKLAKTLKDKTFEFNTAGDTATAAELKTAVTGNALLTALANDAKTQLAASTFEVTSATAGKITVANAATGNEVVINVKLKTTKTTGSNTNTPDPSEG